MADYNTVEEYISMFPDNRAKIMKRVRRTIKAAAPKSEERIRYNMPTYWQGENLIHFACQKNHLGIYPGESGVKAFAKRLDKEGYKHSKGAIQFPFEKPIPYDLIEEITRFRLDEATS
jgi:uncharacterized protein YdhG (YjbR/CyaY superfamily)